MLDFDRLKEILNKQEVKEVLDIGWWKGLHTILCATYGAKVDLVDPDTMQGFQYVKFMRWSHPLITQHKLMIEEFEITEKYDLILLLNVIMFMNKDFVLYTLLPSISKGLREGWKFMIWFALEDDDVMMRGKNHTHFTVEEISFALPELKVIYSSGIRTDEDHPPIGPHQHHNQYMLLSK